MKSALRALAVLCMAGMAGIAAAQVTLTAPGTTARWGSPLSFQVGGSGSCPPGPPPVTSYPFDLLMPYSGGIAVGSGTVASCGAPTSVPLDWTRSPAAWQYFQARATIGGGTSLSNVATMRFDHEFQIPYFGDVVQTTLSTHTLAPYSRCDARIVRVFDRESVHVPMPPANLRTPFEMFVYGSASCGTPSAVVPRQLVNLELPARMGTVWVYDNANGAPQWRNPSVVCGPGPMSPCHELGPPSATYFERSAIVPIVGTASGVSAVLAVAYVQADMRAADLQDLWWAGESESGWGLNIAKDGERMFVSAFIYDADGKPAWAVMPNGQWDPATHVFYGDLYIPHGAPYTSYGPELFDMRAPVGTGSLSFVTENEGHFDYTIGDFAGGKAISRYVFGHRGAVPPPYAGIWWGGGEQNGWGVAIAQQGETVFATWYTYGIDGAPVWFFMPAGQRNAAGKYAGKLYRTTGAPWPGQHYRGASTQVVEVGTMELAFADTNKAAMSAVVGGTTFNYPIFRFQFF